MHVVLGNLLYFCWLDAEYKARLFIIALGSSATAHTFTSVCAWNVFLMDLTHDQYLQELYGNSFSVQTLAAENGDEQFGIEAAGFCF